MSFDRLNIAFESNHSNTGFTHTEIKWCKNRARGHGTALDQTLSFTKAAHEFAERYAFLNYTHDKNNLLQKTSNGFACHRTFELAAESAMCELYERDLLIAHWVQKISPYWLTNSELQNFVNAGSFKVLEKLEVKLFDWKIGTLGEVNGYTVLVGALTLKDANLGHVIVTACGSLIAESIDRIIADFVRAADLVLGRLYRCENFFSVLKKSEVFEPSKHLEYYLNPQSWSGLEWFFQSAKDVRRYDVSACQIEVLPDCPLLPWPHSIVVASNPDLQPLFFGPTKNIKINRNRIKDINNFRLHPLA